MTKISRFLCLAGFLMLLFVMGSQIVSAQATCTLNGKEVPCEEMGEQLGGFLGAGLVLGLIFVVVGIAATVFWIMMLIHAATHEVENKAMWIILMVLTGIIGALIYYFMVKRNFTSTTPTAPTAPKQ